ncbi:MAG: hypothetical protein AAFV07_01430 [Bacteroidota bacterium]
MKSSLGLLTLVLVAVLISACKKNKLCADADDLDKLNISYSDPWILTPGNVTPLAVTLQYPENCENNDPYDGRIWVSIINPYEVPGYQLVVRGDGQEGSTWESPNATPANGLRTCELAAVPVQGGGTPAPGDYEADVEIEFLPFDEVADGVETEISRKVRIQVTDGSFFISFARPNPSIQYPAEPAGGGNSYEIEIEATVTSQNSPVNSVLFRLDNQIWQPADITNGNTVMVNEAASLSAPWAGDHTLTLKAYNQLGDSMVQTTQFSIPDGGGGDNSSLNDHKWDGGGDGINWHDPQNWEDDRLPTATDRAIVDLAGTELVVVSKADVLDPTRVIHRVGAMTINANMEIKGPVTLQIEQADPAQPIGPVRSTINGSLRYSLTQLVDTSPIFNYYSRGAVHELTIQDTVYMEGVAFIQINDAGIPAELRVKMNGPGGRISNATFLNMSLRGNIRMELNGDIDIPGTQLSFSLRDGEGYGPTLINRGKLTFYNEGAFTGHERYSLATFINEGSIQVKRQEPGSRLTFQFIDFVEAAGTAGVIVDTTNDVIDTDRIVNITDCSGTVENLFTRGLIELRSNDVIFKNSRSNAVLMEKSDEFSAIDPIFTVHGDMRAMGIVIIGDGEVQTQPSLGDGSPMRLQELILSRDNYLFIGNPNLAGHHLEIEKLVLRGYIVMASNDTVRLGLLDWQSGGFVNNAESWVYLKSHPQGLASTWDASYQENFTFSTNLRLESGAKLDYKDGKIIFIEEERQSYVHIEPNAVFRFDNNSEDIDWSIPLDGSHDGWVQVDNEGTIIKEHQTTVRIQGCLDNIGGGAVDIQGGVLDFVQLLNPSLTCN